MKNLSQEYNDQKLRQLFEPFGKIISTKVMTDENGKTKGFGFVSFQDSEMAENACKQLNGKQISNGKCLYVSRAQNKSERQQLLKQKFQHLRQAIDRNNRGVNLYVKYLEDSIDDHRLRQEFSKFGSITSAKVMTDSFNRSKGFGFVCFSTQEEAQKAVNQMNNRIIVKKPLYVSIAQRKEDRKVYLMSQHMQRIGGSELRMQSIGMQSMLPSMVPSVAHQHHPQSHPIPSAAAIAFALNPAMALNRF